MLDSWIRIVNKSIKKIPVKKIVNEYPIISYVVPKATNNIPIITKHEEIISSFKRFLIISTINPPITMVIMTTMREVKPKTLKIISSSPNPITLKIMKLIGIVLKMKHNKK